MKIHKQLYEEQRFKECPICGEENLHMYKIEIVMGETRVTIRDERRIRIERVTPSEKGWIVRRYYSCENGCHGFVQSESFHEGNIAELTLPQEVAQKDWFVDIWRD